MFLDHFRLGRGQERWIPQYPSHSVLAHIVIGGSPVRAIPRSPLVVPASVVPKNVGAGFTQQIDIAQVECQSASPIVCAGAAAIPNPRIGPIYRPASLGKVVRVGKVPEIGILPIEQLIS